MSTNVELERAKEQQLAATREALAKLLYKIDGFDGWDVELPTVREDYFARAEAILSSGEVRDADEVRREALNSGVRTAAYSELRAAIEALADKYQDATPMADELRALVADGGREALREVKAQIYREGVKAGRAHERAIQSFVPGADPESILDPGNPYDTDSKEDGE